MNQVGDMNSISDLLYGLHCWTVDCDLGQECPQWVQAYYLSACFIHDQWAHFQQLIRAGWSGSAQEW